MMGTLVSRFPLPIFVDADIKFPIDLKNVEENLMAIDMDRKRTSVTTTK